MASWSNKHPNGYEVTSRGDRRFSAFFAWLQDGRSIEEAYQLDVKGWRAVTNDYKEVKGNHAYNDITREQQFEGFLQLWKTWAAENPDLIEELESLSKGKVLTDMFATSPINQAHALAIILTEREEARNSPFSF